MRRLNPENPTTVSHRNLSVRLISTVLASLSPSVAAPLVLENESYRVEASAESISLTRVGKPGVVRVLRPELMLQFSEKDPGYTDAGAEGTTLVAAWKPAGKAAANSDFWKAGDPVKLRANRVVANTPARLIFTFEDAPTGSLTLALGLDPGKSVPFLQWKLTAARAGWFSVGFTGIEPRSPEKLDFLYQPLVWTWKRFPARPVLTTENFATTAAVFTNAGGVTECLAPDIAEIPYRYATFENARFGLGLRDAEGMARPVVCAPLLGGAESKLAAGDQRSFKLRYLIEPGDWYAGVDAFYRQIAGYRNERENTGGSLNDTFERMLSLAMDDVYSGWIPEMKGADYRFDVPSAVKNVAASHVLSIALTTGDGEIYRRRGLPMLEYLLSRERYLYAADPTITAQNPSHLLDGPAVELGELTALHQLSGGKDSVYFREMQRLFGKPRKLNLMTETGGASWQDYVARYRISRDPAHLAAARDGADRLLKESVWNYPADFTTNAGLRDKGAAFATDFMPPLYDLMELHEETGGRPYLDAAVLAARQLLLWQRSNPMAPDALITANPGGRVPEFFRDGARAGARSSRYSTPRPSFRSSGFPRGAPRWRACFRSNPGPTATGRSCSPITLPGSSASPIWHPMGI